MSRTVPHRNVLTLFHLLQRVEPTATVVGTQEIARIGGLVFTVSLAPSIWAGSYCGLYLTAINPAVGELAATLLSFEEHKVTTGTGSSQRPLRHLDGENVTDLLSGVSTQALETAVTAFTAAFTETAPAAH